MVWNADDNEVQTADESLIALTVQIASRNGRQKFVMILRNFEWASTFQEILICYFNKRLDQNLPQSRKRNLFSPLFNYVFVPLRRHLEGENNRSVSVVKVVEYIAAALYRPTVENDFVSEDPIETNAWLSFKYWFNSAELPLYYKAIIRGKTWRSFGNKWDELTKAPLSETWNNPLSYSSWACENVDFVNNPGVRSFTNADAYGQFQFFFRMKGCNRFARDLEGCAMAGFIDHSQNMFRCKVIEDHELKGREAEPGDLKDNNQKDIDPVDPDLLTDFVTQIQVVQQQHYKKPKPRVIFLEHVYPSKVCIIPFWKKVATFPDHEDEHNAAENSRHFFEALPYLASGQKLEHIGTDLDLAKYFANKHMVKLGLKARNISFLTMLNLTPENDCLLKVEADDPAFFHRSFKWDCR